MNATIPSEATCEPPYVPRAMTRSS
jgi:hypothetical protein